MAPAEPRLIFRRIFKKKSPKLAQIYKQIIGGKLPKLLPSLSSDPGSATSLMLDQCYHFDVWDVFNRRTISSIF